MKFAGPPLVIAEAGVNHNGDLGRARDMVAAAAEAGADIVKFQAFQADELVAPGTGTAAYQSANTGVEDQRALLANLELPMDAFARLADSCRDAGIGFLCTAFDVDQVETLAGLGMSYVKVASGELTNTPALRRFGGLGLPVILSTGMAALDEVRDAVEVLDGAGAPEIAILHCTSLYPAPADSLNLLAIPALAREFDRPIGYSDHSLGWHGAVAAVAFGAVILEKHFTLDRTLPGPDHKASLEPSELSQMIAAVREVPNMLGDGIKRPHPSEIDTAALVRRSWHAARDLSAGAVLGEGDAALRRPADGLAPSYDPMGRTAARAIPAGAPIRAEDLLDDVARPQMPAAR